MRDGLADSWCAANSRQKTFSSRLGYVCWFSCRLSATCCGNASRAFSNQATGICQSLEIERINSPTRSIESENKTLSIFKVLFKEKADYFQNIFEEPNTQFEHDILIIFEKNIFIIEVKSGKKREPLRNPKKAFKRI